MEPGRDKSINDIIERAEQERKRLLQVIENLITYELPAAKQQLKEFSEVFINLARKININFHTYEGDANLIDSSLEKLSDIKQRLEELEINDETIMKEDSFIKEVQEIVELITPSIEAIKNDVYISNVNNIAKSQENKEKLIIEINSLKLERMYLKGELDATKRKRVRGEIEQEINALNIKIDELESKLIGCRYKEETSSLKGEEQTSLQEQQEPTNQELDNNEDLANEEPEDIEK